MASVDGQVTVHGTCGRCGLLNYATIPVDGEPGPAVVTAKGTCGCCGGCVDFVGLIWLGAGHDT